MPSTFNSLESCQIFFLFVSILIAEQKNVTAVQGSSVWLSARIETSKVKIKMLKNSRMESALSSFMAISELKENWKQLGTVPGFGDGACSVRYLGLIFEESCFLLKLDPFCDHLIYLYLFNFCYHLGKILILP